MSYVSAALLLGLDARTFAFLAVLTARLRLPATGHISPVDSLVDRAAARGGFALMRSHPELLGLLTLTWFFNLPCGPVEVALPLHVTDDLQAPGTLLTASPVGTALGGPLTTALGPRATLGGSGLATVALGTVACVLLLARRRNHWPDRSGIEKRRPRSRT